MTSHATVPMPATGSSAALEKPSRPLLTIALPTFNRERYLDRFFTHHLNAFSAYGIEIEILVSDNHSTDSTEEIVAGWAARDSRIRSVRQDENIGGLGNFLYSYRQARGEFTIWIGDDDLLIPEQVARYLNIMRNQPDIVMVQTPWFLINERENNKVIGKFYDHPDPRLFRRGEYAACLDFLMMHHVFPEWFILRTDTAPEVISVGSPIAFHYFVHLAHALSIGSVLFAPEPYVHVTAVSAGDNRHNGIAETLDGWDRFRGGLEYLAAFAYPNGLPTNQALTELIVRLQTFTAVRMGVAVRLSIGAQNWRIAHFLDNRLRCYGASKLASDLRETVDSLAAIEDTFAEAKLLGYGTVLVDPKVEAETLSLLDESYQAMIRQGRELGDAPKAHLCLGAPTYPVGSGDIVLDLAAALRRFAHPAGAARA